MKELVTGLTMLVQGTEREKLKFLFQVYDIDGMFIAIHDTLTNSVEIKRNTDSTV